MAFGKLRAVSAVDQRNVGIDRIGPTTLNFVHRANDRQLAEGIAEVIVAANHVSHAHVVIVDHHREHISRGAVRAQDDVIVDLDIADRDPALDRVLDYRLALVRGLEANHERRSRRRMRGIAIAPAPVVTQRLLGGALGGAHFFKLLLRCIAAVGVAICQQRLGNFDMARAALGLEHRRLVIIEPKPVKPADDRVYRFLGGARLVCILDPQQRLAAVVTRIEPVEQRGARAADMQEAGG